ncbi:hypothetical protein [Poseidonocella sp. HB161398]|uniref:hypothetical protein n=1 Tax=Poseidonocella sp. HB161398 TaxID=2320855 RepID=UPI0011083649|nr:hypothetical protein [Poseidonocella sp. HB161398]
MQPELELRRRALRLTYQRYLEADRAWNMALDDVKQWFPVEDQPYGAVIGEPGSPMRRLFELRMRSLVQFETARQKLGTARRRLAARG